MNAYTSIPGLAAEDAWLAASNAAALWRGLALQQFAYAEAAVTDTLALLSAIKDPGTEIGLPLLVGQRFDALARAVGPEGPFVKQGGKVSAALADFQRYDALRPTLTHGVIKVAVCKNAEWVALLSVQKFRNGEIVRDTYVLEGSSAEERLRALTQAANRLRNVLRTFKSSLCKAQSGIAPNPSAQAAPGSR